MKGTDNTRLIWLSAEAIRKLQIERRKTGKSLSRVIEHLFAEELANEQKN